MFDFDSKSSSIVSKFSSIDSISSLTISLSILFKSNESFELLKVSSFREAESSFSVFESSCLVFFSISFSGESNVFFSLVLF